MLVLVGLWPIALLVLVPVFWLRLVNALRKRHGRPQLVRPPGNRWLTNGAVLSILLLAVTLIRAFSTGAFWDPIQGRSVRQAADRTHPNIYVMMVDGYPGADVLESRFGIDNKPFERELTDRGLDVAGRSRSNYSKTWLTLASFFQMTYVQDLPAISAAPRAGPEQYRLSGQLVDTGLPSPFCAMPGTGSCQVGRPSQRSL